MVKKTCSVLAAALLMGLASCSDDNPWMGEAGKGAIKLNLKADGGVKKAAPDTRAGEVNGHGVYFQTPEPAEFSIKLAKAGGEERHFETLEHFANAGGFEAGRYTVTALYGNVNEEGFDLPHFSGSADVTVFEGETAEVEITASLANSIFSIEYSEAFKKYFKDYYTTLQTTGLPVTIYPEDTAEGKYAYMAPKEVNLSVTFTNAQGQTVTVNPAAIEAEPGHHYNVTMNVKGEGYDATLDIKFDDSLTREDVYIDLTEDLFTSKAPSVTPSGFDNGEEKDFLEGMATADKYRFDVIAHGGLEAVELTLGSSSYTPPFGEKVELISADPTVQNQIAAMGIDVKGLYHNPDRMAYVDFSNLAKNLKEGKYTLSLTAKDKLTRVSETVSMVLNVIGAKVEAFPGSAILGLNKGTLTVAYNGVQPEDNLKFKTMNSFGNWVDCRAVFGEPQKTRAFETLYYPVTLDLPDITDHKEVKVKVLFGGNEIPVVLPIEEPRYDIEVDAFATRVWVKVKPENEDQRAVITKLLGFKDVASSRIERDEDEGLIWVSGFTADSDATITPVLLGKEGTAKSFHTEKATDVENGGFDNIEENKYVIDPLQTGGTMKKPIVGGTVTINSSIYRSTATGWADLNDWTCYLNPNGANKNTWFVVPSTWVESDGGNNVAVISTVGYSHEGEEIPQDTPSSSTVTSKGYFSTKTPQNLSVKAGEMFLGSYSYNGQETRTDGKEWSARPSSLSFDYKYIAEDGETAVAYIYILGEQNKVLASQTVSLEATSGYTTKTINIDNYQFGEKAKGIKLGFKSSSSATPKITIPQGDALNDGVASALNYNNKKVAANEYKAVARGSKLTIDNVKLNY